MSIIKMGKERADKRFFINNVCYLKGNQVLKEDYTQRGKKQCS
jgi:hypothetical protein